MTTTSKLFVDNIAENTPGAGVTITGLKAALAGTFDVTAYGAKGDGITDDTSAIQAAQTALEAAGGGVLFFPAGIYKTTGTITCFTTSQSKNIPGRMAIRGAGEYGSIIRPTVAPVFRIGNTANGTDGFAMSDILFQLTSNLWWDAGLVQMRLVRFYHLQRVAMWSGTDLSVDYFSYNGFLFEFDTSYTGKLDSCHARGHGVYLTEIHGQTRPTEQQDTWTFDNCLSEGMAHTVIRSPDVTTDIHNLGFYQLKHVMDASWTEAKVSVETTLNGALSAGVSSIVVTSGTSLVANDFLWLDTGSNIELVKIGAGYAGGTTVPLAHPTRFAHSSGVAILKGGFAVSVPPRVHSVTLNEPHFEFSAAGVLVAACYGVTVRKPYGSTQDVIRQVAGPTHMIRVEGSENAGVSGVLNIVRVTTLGDDVTSSPPILVGPYFNPNTGNPPTSLYLNDTGGTRGYFAYDVGTTNPTPVTTKIYPTADSTVIDSLSAGGGLKYSRDLNGNMFFAGDLTATGGFRQRLAGISQTTTVAASQTNVVLTDAVAPRGQIMVRSGSVTGIAINLSSARTAGTLTVQVQKSTDSGATWTDFTGALLAISTNVSQAQVAFVKDNAPFAAGTMIRARVTTDGSWAPTANNLDVVVEVEH